MYSTFMNSYVQNFWSVRTPVHHETQTVDQQSIAVLPHDMYLLTAIFRMHQCRDSSNSADLKRPIETCSRPNNLFQVCGRTFLAPNGILQYRKSEYARRQLRYSKAVWNSATSFIVLSGSAKKGTLSGALISSYKLRYRKLRFIGQVIGYDVMKRLCERQMGTKILHVNVARYSSFLLTVVPPKRIIQ